VASDSFGDFMAEINRYPLLIPVEEIELARKIKAAAELKSLERELTPSEKMAIKRGERAKQKFVNCNLRLVVHITRRYRHVVNSLEMADLVQEGAVGLMRAVELFDATKGYKFSTYAYWWIRQSMQRAIDMKERALRIPTHVVEKLSKVRKVKHQLGLTLGRKPTKEEVAAALEMTVPAMEEMLFKGQRMASLDQNVINGEGDTTILDLMHDPNQDCADDIFDAVDLDNRIDRLYQCIESLDERTQYVLRHRNGLDGADIRTSTVLAQELGVTRERVRQMHVKAEQKLFSMMNRSNNLV
jgi:RNA polymerase sigma factor (sigma-70 family)